MHEKNQQLKFVRTPKFDEGTNPMRKEPNLVIEYYSITRFGSITIGYGTSSNLGVLTNLSFLFFSSS